LAARPSRTPATVRPQHIAPSGWQHRSRNHCERISLLWKEVKQEDVMGRGLLLWLLGIPIPIIILMWVLGGLHG
jgi:hypothetical protein